MASRAAHARRIHKFYGKDSLEIVSDDPYVLARTINGIGFRTADAIAEKLGIPRNSIQRARAAIIYLLERMADDGHVFAPFDYLEHQFESGLEMDPELASRALEELQQSGEVVAEESMASIPPFTSSAFTKPRRLSPNGSSMLTAGRPMGKSVIERAMSAAGAPVRHRSIGGAVRALRCALQSKVTVITGGPGTGKTTLLKSLLAALDPSRIEADAGGADRTRRAPACGGDAAAKPKPSIACSSTRRRRKSFCAIRAISATHQLPHRRRGLDDGCRARGEPGARADARVRRSAGGRSRSAAVGRARQRPQGRDRIGAGAGGRVARGLSAGAREPDRRQRASAQSR